MTEKLCQLKKKGGRSVPSVIEIEIYREVQIVIENNASQMSFLASNAYNSSAPTSTYPAQWFVAGSNDQSTWTTLLNQTHTQKSDYNTNKTVNVSGYKYLRFGSGTQFNNYQNIAKFKNITFS